MKNDSFDFLKSYGNKILRSIQSAPQWPEEAKHVSDEVTLNFSDDSQLVVSSSYDDVDTFFAVDEDVVFSIYEATGHIPFCNIGRTRINTIEVDEEIVSIKVYFDEISYADKKISDKTLSYPIALFIQTTSRSIGLCKDYLTAVWLDADYINADETLLYTLDACWGEYEDVDSYVVKRQVKDYITGEVNLIEEKQFC